MKENLICRIFGHRIAEKGYSFSHTSVLGYDFYTLDPRSCKRCGTWRV